jgi:1,2-diacylglycerol 3-alpha-glucosyltransferase
LEIVEGHPTVRRIATIWSTYGPYHLARVAGLRAVYPESAVYCLSHCESSDEYPFFNQQPQNHVVIDRRPLTELRFVTSFFRTCKVLLELRPDAVLTCGYERAETLAAVIYSRFFRAKVILMLENQLDDSERRWLKEHLKAIYLKLFHGFMYGGDTHHNYLRRLNVPNSKGAYGYSCVDNDRLSEISAEHRKGSATPFAGDYFLCVARLIEKKNIPRLVKAFAKWRSNLAPEANWKLVIVGDGPERAAIEEIISKTGVGDSVVLRGEIGRIEEICRYYAFAKCFVLASHHNEQWGLVVNEAMACGLPVLVSEKCGCANSLVQDGKNGYKLRPESIEDIAEKLHKVYLARAQLVQMGEESKRIIAGYTPRQFALNVKSLLEETNGR